MIVRRPTGLVYWRAYRAGQLLWSERGSNLVVDAAAGSLARIAAGVGSVTSIAIGTNGTAPAGGDTALTASFVRPILSAQSPSTGVARFNWRIFAAEMPTMTAREIGLLDDQGTLIARKVWSTPQSLELGIELDGDWSLTF
ncbi:MAG: hypothetical protein IV100_12650 [Myxococcales bacterium]|uniref:hypothetical protein n=1 Tax=Sediminibacterium sp. TaxID=1917865 RepID=UPI001E15106B|nr:hypothetical protein [Sediminibacterium sp.]MBT9485848.1 hypothetical protein [Sediminibacterium sp.]MBT9556876.1 hypothetical protein [Myxococcales bacterium]